MDKRYKFAEDILEKFTLTTSLYKVVFYITPSTYFIIKRIQPPPTDKFIVHYIRENVHISSDKYNDPAKFLLTLNKYGRPRIQYCRLLFFEPFMKYHPIYYNAREYNAVEEWEFLLFEDKFRVIDPILKDSIPDASKKKRTRTKKSKNKKKQSLCLK